MDVLLPKLSEIQNAAQLVYRSMPATPQYSWPLLNVRAGAEVWVKHENHTPVGAFKVETRGCVCPAGHVAKYPNAAYGNAVMFKA